MSPTTAVVVYPVLGALAGILALGAEVGSCLRSVPPGSRVARARAVRTHDVVSPTLRLLLLAVVLGPVVAALWSGGVGGVPLGAWAAAAVLTLTEVAAAVVVRLPEPAQDGGRLYVADALRSDLVTTSFTTAAAMVVLLDLVSLPPPPGLDRAAGLGSRGDLPWPVLTLAALGAATAVAIAYVQHRLADPEVPLPPVDRAHRARGGHGTDRPDGPDGDQLVITLDAASPDPPYVQVREQVDEQVRSGALVPGTRLPTVRRLAGDLGIAPNTVARAYRELEALGVIETRGRAGSVVTGAGVDRAAREAAHDFAQRVRDLGLDLDQAVALLRRAYG